MPAITNKRAQHLIHLTDGEAWTTSVVIAEEFGRPHKNVLRELDTLIADGTIDRGLEIEPTIRDVPGPKGAIRQERAYRLNERAALIAMPFIYQLAKLRIEALGQMVGKSLPGERFARLAA